MEEHNFKDLSEAISMMRNMDPGIVCVDGIWYSSTLDLDNLNSEELVDKIKEARNANKISRVI